MSELYERMKAKGIDMSWYEKGKRGRRNQAIPLDDEACSNLSVYLLKENGSLWSITHVGSPYQQVRPATKPIPHSIYICLCCKRQWNDAPINNITESVEHREVEGV